MVSPLPPTLGSQGTRGATPHPLISLTRCLLCGKSRSSTPWATTTPCTQRGGPLGALPGPCPTANLPTPPPRAMWCAPCATLAPSSAQCGFSCADALGRHVRVCLYAVDSARAADVCHSYMPRAAPSETMPPALYPVGAPRRGKRQAETGRRRSNPISYCPGALPRYHCR